MTYSPYVTMPVMHVTIYWEHTGFQPAIAAHLPGIGPDFFDSFEQLECYCLCEYSGYEKEFIEITSEEQRAALAAQGAFSVF